MTQVSIVSTLYKSEQFVDEFIARCLSAIDKNGLSGELILVDDGSPDASLESAINRARRDGRIKVIQLARNFGHHPAILTAIEHAKGDLVFAVDSDLEEPPELLTEFLKVMRSQEADVVYGVHDQSKGTYFRRITSSMFWRTFNALSEVKTERNICNVRLMSRDYVEALRLLPERNVFLGGLYGWPGFRQIPLLIERRPRKGRASYTIFNRVSLLVRSLVAFSTRPLLAIFFIGLLIFAMSFAASTFFIIRKIVYPDSILTGFTSLIVSVWLLGGVTISAIGVVGFYLAHVYVEAKGRPRTVIRRIFEFGEAEPEIETCSRRNADSTNGAR